MLWSPARLVPLAFAGLAACGGGPSKPAADAKQPAHDEDVPKWDSSSETADQSTHPKLPPPSSGDTTVTNAPSAASAMPVSPVQQQHRGDQYDKEATDNVLRRAARQAKEHCGSAKDEDGKAKGPWGKTSVSVNLGHNGHSKGVTIGPPYDSAPSGRCVLQAFANLTFPPWSGPDTQVTWEVELVQPK